MSGPRKLRQSGPSRHKAVGKTSARLSTRRHSTVRQFFQQTRQATCIYGTPARPACHFCVPIRDVLCPSGGHCSPQAAKLRPQPAKLMLESFHLAPRSVGPWEKVTERGEKTQGRLAPVAFSHQQKWLHERHCSCTGARMTRSRMSQMSCDGSSDVLEDRVARDMTVLRENQMYKVVRVCRA